MQDEYPNHLAVNHSLEYGHIVSDKHGNHNAVDNSIIHTKLDRNLKPDLDSD